MVDCWPPPEDAINSLDTLNAFIASNPDPRELKRALTVKMALIPVRIAKFKRSWALRHAPSPSGSIAFIGAGADGLRLAHQGSQPYLAADQRQQVLTWLAQEKAVSASGLAAYIAYRISSRSSTPEKRLKKLMD